VMYDPVHDPERPYRAIITIHSHGVRLGDYSVAADAHAAYQERCLELGRMKTENGRRN